jgi:hypothetical protein
MDRKQRTRLERRYHAVATGEADTSVVRQHMKWLPALGDAALSALRPLQCLVYPLEVNSRLYPPSAWIHNPSVTNIGGQTRVIIRALEEKQRSTTNLLGYLDNHLRVRDLRVVRDITGAPRFDGMSFGIEDIRLFELHGRLWGSGTTCDRVCGDRRPKIAVLQFNTDGDITHAHVQPTRRMEKNWMPLAEDDRLRFIYRTMPTAVLQFDPVTKLCGPDVMSFPESVGEIRGGSQLIRWRKDAYGHPVYLAVVHKVHEKRREFERNPYVHYLIEFDVALKPQRISRPFYFTQLGIEFCAGMMWWRGGLVLSFGVEDRAAKLALVDPHTATRMLDEGQPC